MSIIPEIPGCIFAGYTEHPNINEGKPIPIFEPITPKDRPDINTLEGWTLTADKQNRCSFFVVFGREPVSRDELYNWVYSQTTDPAGGLST